MRTQILLLPCLLNPLKMPPFGSFCQKIHAWAWEEITMCKRLSNTLHKDWVKIKKNTVQKHCPARKQPPPYTQNVQLKHTVSLQKFVCKNMHRSQSNLSKSGTFLFAKQNLQFLQLFGEYLGPQRMCFKIDFCF